MFKRKTLFNACAILLTLVLVFPIACKNNSQTALTRTAQLEIAPQYVSTLQDLFYEDDVTLDANEDFVQFAGFTMFVGEYEFIFNCTFDFDTLTFTFVAEYDGETETEVKPAIITDMGALNVKLEYPEQNYYIDYYKDLEQLDILIAESETIIEEDGLFSWFGRKVRAVVIAVYVIVAQTAEQIRAEINKTYNEGLERNGNGVTIDNYITNQGEIEEIGKRSGNYQFGFSASFADTGCPVAAAYNLRKALDSPVPLSEVIYSFEKWAIEFAVGWGYLGSNPRQMNKYFDNVNIDYTKYSSKSSFTNAVDLAPANTKIVMAAWTPPGYYLTLHSFYINKAEHDFISYNYMPESEPEHYSSIEDFYGRGFTVGYIIHGIE